MTHGFIMRSLERLPQNYTDRRWGGNAHWTDYKFRQLSVCSVPIGQFRRDKPIDMFILSTLLISRARQEDMFLCDVVSQRLRKVFEIGFFFRFTGQYLYLWEIVYFLRGDCAWPARIKQLLILFLFRRGQTDIRLRANTCFLSVWKEQKMTRCYKVEG